MNRKKIIIEFFKFLESKFEYAILHHTKEIFKTSKDIDFIVGCRHKKDYINCVKQFTDQFSNLEVLNIYNIDNKIYRVDLLFFGKENIELIELDCCILQQGEDLLRINSKKLLRNRIQVEIDGEMFYKISNNDEYKYYVSKKAFKKEKIEDHIEFLKQVNSKKTDTEILSDYLEYTRYYNTISYKTKRLRNKFLLLLSRLKHNPLLTVVFLGPDGSGKTSVINKLSTVDFFRYTPYFHLKPIKQNNDSVIVENPHELNNYSKAVSFIKLIYFVFQYNFGWVLNIFNYRIKSSLVLFDRYYYDLFADPKRYRYNGSKKNIRFFSNFIPKPDLIFLLITDPKIIYHRKKEVEYNELIKQIASYKELNVLENAHIINVDDTLDGVFFKISKIITREMQLRHKF
jgi:thymidylate kinase